MKRSDYRYYLVCEDILPEAIRKTIQVKELLNKDENISILDAVAKYGLSRSAFYKYKDFVFPFYEVTKNKIISMSLLLEHKPGVLSRVLNFIACDGGSIITINQGIPMQGVAHTTLTVDTKNMSMDLEALMDRLRMLDGVKRIEIVGQD